MTARLRVLAMGALFLGAASSKAQLQGPLGEDVRAVLGDPNATPEPTPDIPALLGPPAGARLSGSALNALAADVSSKLRCPVCQGVSIADSPSGMATNMREQTRDLLAQGYSPEQVMTYFEKSYGEFVRLEPPMRGLNSVLWFAPLALLLAGAAFVYVRARPAPLDVAAAPSAASDEGDPELAEYLKRVRRDAGTSS